MKEFNLILVTSKKFAAGSNPDNNTHTPMTVVHHDYYIDGPDGQYSITEQHYNDIVNAEYDDQYIADSYFDACITGNAEAVKIAKITEVMSQDELPF